MTSTYNPVFHRWFQEQFSDPAAWTAARNTYVRTTAAWSMVGYVVGLGDRHTENILFDSTSGACVHVDFACMFNRNLEKMHSIDIEKYFGRNSPVND